MTTSCVGWVFSTRYGFARRPRTLFDNYLPALVASGAMTADERLAFDAAWRAAEAHPGGFFATPPMLEVLAIRR